MIVYIAGPMTGIKTHNFPAFDEAKERWEKAGHLVYSPADISRDYWLRLYGEVRDPDTIVVNEKMYRVFMRMDAKAIADSDAIALLPGWQKSKGARKELHIANALELPIFSALTMEELA